MAEDFVRDLIHLEPQMSMRVRFLAGNKAAVGGLKQLLMLSYCLRFLIAWVHVELDKEAVEKAMPQVHAIDAELRRLGKKSMYILFSFDVLLNTRCCVLNNIGFDAVDVRAFRSGSLSGYNPNAVVQHTSAIPAARIE